ncbi:hypothetical protein BD410DRAFT_893635 [Rickenella mellea]|uniref:Chromatin remodeling complex protein n=1 Tax=Rickenella mellea TaxID=50990 RepID=A0A4Y7QMQ4_9AGAM|nr:hypothetical protein BD410DRAFT_893635 [Rickenella mellea]
MPTCRRKRVLLTQPPIDIDAHDPNRDVYLLPQTGEIFDSYEAYAARMSFYKLKQFQCEVTGKSGLDYFQALDSEHQEARTLHSRFPEPLKAAVLRTVQWQVMGRLDHLVEAVYERFKDRYFQGEKVFIDVQGDKFWARVAQVFPPKTLVATTNSPNKSNHSDLKRKRESSVTSSQSVTTEADHPMPIHSIGADLKLPTKEATERDDPAKYFYKVQILEEEKNGFKDGAADAPVDVDGTLVKSERRESGRVKEKGKLNGYDVDGEAKAKWGGSLMEVQCQVMSYVLYFSSSNLNTLNVAPSRDRLAFSKSLLRRFLRDCLDRDSSLASPWTVKPAIAARFDVPSEMPDEVKADVEQVRKGEIDKRKRVWEEKEAQAEREGRYTKKMKKRDEREQKAVAKAAEVESKQKDAQTKAKAKQEKMAAEQAAKEEAERLMAEKAKQKKKPVRYPTEDLDVWITEKDKKAGMIARRPPFRKCLPFLETKGAFDSFLMTWNFFMCFGQPLHLSSFTLDEYEHALQHSLAEPPCNLLAEIHSVLIYNLRTLPFERHSAVLSLLNSTNEPEASQQELPPSKDLVNAMADVGNNWERVPLKHSEGREGWEEALIGCLKDHATVEKFPRLRHILTHLLLKPTDTANSPHPSESHPSTPRSSGTPITEGYTVTSPYERYHTLPPTDKIFILQFMCELAVSSKSIRMYMESCEEQLTALRKEKIEVNRQKRQLVEEMAALTGEKEAAEAATEEPQPPNDLSDVESDGVALSEDASESGSVAGGRRSSASRQLSLRLKAQQGLAHAKQRELARQKTASAKLALAEHRRLDEEVNKLERRLESIEREFRKLLGVARVKPMGRDRYLNRFWWFDGCGGSSLLGSGGAVQYGTGRIFIQGPSEFDEDFWAWKGVHQVDERRKDEEGEEPLAPGSWAVYTEIDEVRPSLLECVDFNENGLLQITEFIKWLNPKGHRELALKNALSRWWDHLAPGVRKRTADTNAVAKLPEARRSMRGKNPGSDISREPYMMWTNRKAIN